MALFYKIARALDSCEAITRCSKVCCATSVVYFSSNVGNRREADYVVRLTDDRQLSLGWQLLSAQHERVRSVETAEERPSSAARRILQFAVDYDLDTDWQELAARLQSGGLSRRPRRSAFLCAKQHDRDGAIRL